MHPPIFVRELNDPERVRLEAALRASDAFTVRRAQIVSLSADGRRPREIACGLRCAVQTVRNGIRAFNATGVESLTATSSRPWSAAPVLGEVELERLRAILHQPPRAFGRARSTWTLASLARVAHAQGLSPTVLSGETIRQALLRLGVGRRRAKRWLTSPDPAHAQKTPPRPADPLGAGPARLGGRLRGRGLVLTPRPAGPAHLGSGGRAAPPLRARRRSRRPRGQGAGLLRPVAARARADAAAVRRRAADQRRDLHLPRLGRRAPRGRGRARAGAGLGQRPLARQPRGPRLDQGPRPPGQARRRLPPAGLSPAEPEPVAEPDRAQVGARQACRRRARAQAHRRRTPAAPVRSLSLPAPPAPRTAARLNMH